MNHGPNKALIATGVFAGLAVLLLVPTPNPRPPTPPPTPLEVPVPLLEVTPTADAGPMIAMVLRNLPAPGPNQIKDPSKCHWPAKFVEGGCWLAVDGPKPPCVSPDGSTKLWPHADRCWTPYAEAKPVPTSGELRPLGVAEP